MALRVKGLKKGFIPLRSSSSLPQSNQHERDSQQGVVVLRPPAFRQKRSCFIFNDGSVSPHYVEVPSSSVLSRSLARCRSLVPNVLSRRDLAWPGAVCPRCLERYIDRGRPRDRWNSRVGALCSRSWSCCYFVASEATIFSKRGSPRSESQ